MEIIKFYLCASALAISLVLVWSLIRMYLISYHKKKSKKILISFLNDLSSNYTKQIEYYRHNFSKANEFALILEIQENLRKELDIPVSRVVTIAYFPDGIQRNYLEDSIEKTAIETIKNIYYSRTKKGFQPSFNKKEVEESKKIFFESLDCDIFTELSKIKQNS